MNKIDTYKLSHGFWGMAYPNKNKTLNNERVKNIYTTYKWSKYNVIQEISAEVFVIYNCLSDNYVYVIRELIGLINEKKYDVNKIKDISPDLFYYLIDNEFIVNSDLNEAYKAINDIYGRDSDYYELIINPTLDCNLKCWYCYESHHKCSEINIDTLKKIMRFIDKTIEDVQIKDFVLTFFGGEPLMKFDNIVFPLVEYTKGKCDDSNKKFHVCFVTNGVLLNKRLVDKLYTIGVCTFQVPFDGNQQYHDKVKFLDKRRSTYDIVIENIMYALSKGNKFIIRCNYTEDNIDSFSDLIQVFKEYASECITLGLVEFSYHKIWQVKDLENKKYVIDKYKKDVSAEDLSFHYCYADKKNSIVINYNGDIYKCTARDFRKENREGYLDEKGEIITNDIFRKRIEIRTKNKSCINCSILPICNVCSQIHLEHQNYDGCLRFFSEEDKIKLLNERVRLIVKK